MKQMRGSAMKAYRSRKQSVPKKVTTKVKAFENWSDTASKYMPKAKRTFRRGIVTKKKQSIITLQLRWECSRSCKLNRKQKPWSATPGFLYCMLYNICMSTDPFDEWYSETHDGTGELELEGDVDECVEDSFDDIDLL